MATIRLKTLTPTVMLNDQGQAYIQLTGLDEDGAAWSFAGDGWIQVPMNIKEEAPAAEPEGLIKVVQ